MLKNLVRKFKSQSLNEDEDDNDNDEGQKHREEQRPSTVQEQILGPPPIAAVPNLRRNSNSVRHQCCPHKASTCPHHNHQRYHQQHLIVVQGGGSTTTKYGGGGDEIVDSGTESDDEELEFIETNSTHSVPISQTSDYYASQRSLSINSCRSSHCGSPLMGLSDQECNSWESIGSESGINLRANTMIKRQYRPQRRSETSKSMIPMKITTTSAPFNLNYEFLLNPPPPPSSDNKNGNNNKITSTSTATTTIRTDEMITEELPNHHYHTRQQFQRLKQQISMKNGEICHDHHIDHGDDQDDQDGTKKSSTTIAAAPPFSKIINTDDKIHNTAFSPFYRFVAPACPSSISIGGDQRNNINNGLVAAANVADEMEMGNGGSQQQFGDVGTFLHRRSRSSTLSAASVISSSGISSISSLSSSSSSSSSSSKNGGEKRKWSQTRQQQQQQKHKCNDSCCCHCSVCGTGITDHQQQQQHRTVLHAARKTPVTLLYPCPSSGPVKMGDVVDQGQVQVAVVRKTRFSTRKKTCRGSDGAAADEDDNNDEANKAIMDTTTGDRGCPDNPEQQEDEDRFVKRPSLDFNKMRAKRVGHSGKKDSKKSKRSNSLTGSSSSSTPKSKDYQYGGYHLRSSRRQQQHCLFRPLDPAGTAAVCAGTRNLNAESASWFACGRKTPVVVSTTTETTSSSSSVMMDC